MVEYKRFYVNLERTVRLEFCGEISVPAETVAEGKKAVRQFILDYLDDGDCDREVECQNLSFDEMEEGESC